MHDFIQVIYCSAAGVEFKHQDLRALLTKARKNNAASGITGILLYTDGCFFQVLEGRTESVRGLFDRIQSDSRHANVTVIHESVTVKRAFADWTMAFADISQEDLNRILGAKDHFNEPQPYLHWGQDRALKLVEAFKQGRWRTRLTGKNMGTRTVLSPQKKDGKDARPDLRQSDRDYSFAFQPIVNVETEEIFSYEALIRTLDNRPAGEVFKHIADSELHAFDQQSRVEAIKLAGLLGLTGRLNLNFLPLCLKDSNAAIDSVLETAVESQIRPDQIVLELLEKEIIDDSKGLAHKLQNYRTTGLTFAIDDFGSGYAGLNLLADFQPDYIKLDIHLLSSIHQNGPRQAIVKGVLRTCRDLGIDVVAEGVEQAEDFLWLKDQGITLFQGWLFARPKFEILVDRFELPGKSLD